MRNPEGRAARRITEAGDDEVVTSIIVAGELRFGSERKGSPRLAERLEGALSRIPVLSLEVDADRHYGKLRANLERRGLIIGTNDMLIAAHALALGATLVTDNVREFERVEGLAVENWLRD